MGLFWSRTEILKAGLLSRAAWVFFDVFVFRCSPLSPIFRQRLPIQPCSTNNPPLHVHVGVASTRVSFPLSLGFSELPPPKISPCRETLVLFLSLSLTHTIVEFLSPEQRTRDTQAGAERTRTPSRSQPDSTTQSSQNKNKSRWRERSRYLKSEVHIPGKC